ncbi:MAG TPA: hypothetical protein VKI65_17150 [Gemmataceae bacterium]|nr:hypothetical protein [Gemmataceae bacterium]
MRLSYLTSDEVHFDWLSRLAERFGIALESADNVKVSTDPLPDAVLYDWDFLPPGQREVSARNCASSLCPAWWQCTATTFPNPRPRPCNEAACWSFPG